MTDNQINDIEDIASHYGWDSQCWIAIEEMSELIKAICKFERKWSGSRISLEKRTGPEREAMIEEIADVIIMVQQLKYLLSAEYETEIEIDKKLERQKERILKEIMES